MAKAVLIVDDNRFLREAVCEFFSREVDFEVCGEAENGQMAIEKAKQVRPDLIVLDLSIPVMNGLDAARALKQLIPEVPMIMYSGYGDSSLAHEARLNGISELISKSDPVSKLIVAARKLVSQKAA